MKEQIKITFDDLDNLSLTLKSIELLFQKLIDYYGKTNIENLKKLILCCGAYFGQLLIKLGYDEDLEK